MGWARGQYLGPEYARAIKQALKGRLASLQRELKAAGLSCNSHLMNILNGYTRAGAELHEVLTALALAIREGEARCRIIHIITCCQSILTSLLGYSYKDR